jgi:hypothetical protein
LSHVALVSALSRSWPWPARSGIVIHIYLDGYLRGRGYPNQF